MWPIASPNGTRLTTSIAFLRPRLVAATDAGEPGRCRRCAMHRKWHQLGLVDPRTHGEGVRHVTVGVTRAVGRIGKVGQLHDSYTGGGKCNRDYDYALR